MPTPLVKQNTGNSLDLVDVKEIRGNVVVVKDGSLRQIVMVGGVNFALKSEEEQNLIIQGYQSFLNGIDFPLQIIIHSRKVNIDAYIETLSARKEVESSPLLQSQIDEYISFIKEFVAKNAIMEKTFLVVVPFYPVGDGIKQTTKAASGAFSSIMGIGKKSPASDKNIPQNTESDDEISFQENAEQLSQRVGQIINGIGSMGLEATTLDNQELLELFYNFYNPQTVERGAIQARNK